ncbi:MAG: sigma-70 family RNA polymerase sigma factor, partial [Planctomycetia bacterium]|nr:sigma-70 family RNA polymerase sigma factor [Planctomycetia bacterium]
MGSDSPERSLRQLGFVVGSWQEDRRTDIELLSRFVQTRDEQAFSTLVGRYGQLVWGVCLRVLGNRADAEDAFQATFLRLASAAERIVKGEALASWLFSAARGCAIDLRRMITRQRRIEERLATVVERAGGVAPPTDLRLLLDDELGQLPARDRLVLILCCLEGRTYADVALELRCSVAAVHRRLVRAQTGLRRRLRRINPTVASAFALGTLTLTPLSACAAPPALLARTVEAGLPVAKTGLLSDSRAGLLAGESTASTMQLSALASAVAVAVLVCGLVMGGIARFAPDDSQQPTPLPSASVVSPNQQSPEGSHDAVSGIVRGPSGEPVAGATLAALARRPFGPGERGLRDEVLAVTTTDEQGRFTLAVPDDFTTWFADRLVTVHASAPNMSPTTLPVRVPSWPKGTLDLRLSAASPLKGRLRDPSGQPAGGVRVEVVRVGDVVAEPVLGGSVPQLPPDWPAPVMTATDGTFAIPTLGGCSNVWVRINDPRFALDTFRVDHPDRSGGVDFQLAEFRTLAVEVRAADTGIALAGARLTLITDRIRSHPHFCTTEHGILGPRIIPSDIDAITDECGAMQVRVARGDHVEVLVHPPADAGPYVGVRTQVEVENTGGTQSLVVRLPRGRWVGGVVTDGPSGKPLAGVAVHWGRETATKPEWRDDVLLGRDAITRTDSEGSFRLAVLPGTVSLRAFGSTLDYASVPARVPGTTNTTLFAHHVISLKIAESGDIPPVRVALTPEKAIAGRVDHPVQNTNTTLLLCSARVSPVRPYASIALPVREGSFTVPGCRSGYTTRAYFLDPVARLGAVIDVSPDTPAPVAKLAPCGSIRLRVVDQQGEPQAGVEVSVSLLVERDRRSSEEPVADAQSVEWFDAVNYLTRPKTNAAGEVELPTLIPSARYVISVGSG